MSPEQVEMIARSMMVNSLVHAGIGMLVGVLMTSVINGMARRDDILSRLDSNDKILESISDDIEDHGRRFDAIEKADSSACSGSCGCKPSEDDVKVALAMLQDTTEFHSVNPACI